MDVASGVYDASRVRWGKLANAPIEDENFPMGKEH
jgi:hypothetical protein